VSNLESTGQGAFAITPHDSNNLTTSTRGICFATAGALKVRLADGNDVTFTSGALAAGIIHPLRVIRVWSTGTTAASIFGVY
jgi:hypothetical protein